jgi:5'(3')-deoxyribonucleotidase
MTSFNLHECLATEDADELLRIFKSTELIHALTPVEHAQWGLETLINQGYQVFLATATPYQSFADKVEWVCKAFPCVTPKDIICISNKSVLNCDVMIDDNLENLTHNLCERVVLDYPWNRDKDKDFVYDIHRAYSWRDIVNIINELERKDREWENR